MTYTDSDLVKIAEKARESAYCPYSGFAVGAALLTADGEVYTGLNIENAAFSPSVCAERTAFFKAISDGKKNFVKIAVVGGKVGERISAECTPCGVCRQVMAEFCNSDFVILTYDGASITSRTLSEILPASFGLKQ